MEIKTSITGQKRYPREFKQLVVEKRFNENWTWPETAQWIEEDYDIKIPNGTLTTWSRWYEEYIEGRAGESSSKVGNKTKNWQSEEDKILRMCVEADLTGAQTAEFMNETPELNFRRYTTESIYSRKRKLPELLRTKKNPGLEDMIKECKKLLLEVCQTLVEYINTHAVKVQCDICNHIWQSSMVAIKQHNGCPKCAGSFVGGKPVGPQPALVYLLGFLDWGKCKIGYAEIGGSLSPEEAIHKTSKSRKYPYDYTILAYDLSTKTGAGDLEEELKAQTEERRSFIETQEFAGYTEFRDIEVVKQILPQFKTVLDMAFKI